MNEIAELLSISDNTVKTRLKRGREKLRNKLEGGEWDAEFSSETSNR
ncbi:sigma factor-like helix-turn-helix DNA-binding protein [Solibacillus sp. FSL W8-0474]